MFNWESLVKIPTFSASGIISLKHLHLQIRSLTSLLFVIFSQMFGLPSESGVRESVGWCAACRWRTLKWTKVHTHTHTQTLHGVNPFIFLDWSFMSTPWAKNHRHHICTDKILSSCCSNKFNGASNEIWLFQKSLCLSWLAWHTEKDEAAHCLRLRKVQKSSVDSCWPSTFVFVSENAISTKWQMICIVWCS